MLDGSIRQITSISRNHRIEKIKKEATNPKNQKDPPKKDTSTASTNQEPEKKKGLFRRLFGKKDKDKDKEKQDE